MNKNIKNTKNNPIESKLQRKVSGVELEYASQLEEEIKSGPT